MGTTAGQIIMDGLLHQRIPIWLRRTHHHGTAVILRTSGVDPTEALLKSQVVLSFGVTFALGALLWFTSRRSILGDNANTPVMIAVMGPVTVTLVALNLMLLDQQMNDWLSF